jgi:hypothetical protein
MRPILVLHAILLPLNLFRLTQREARLNAAFHKFHPFQSRSRDVVARGEGHGPRGGLHGTANETPEGERPDRPARPLPHHRCLPYVPGTPPPG